MCKCNCEKQVVCNECEVRDLSTSCVTYKGEDLNNINVKTNTQLEIIIKNIDTKLATKVQNRDIVAAFQTMSPEEIIIIKQILQV